MAGRIVAVDEPTGGSRRKRMEPIASRERRIVGTRGRNRGVAVEGNRSSLEIPIRIVAMALVLISSACASAPADVNDPTMQSASMRMRALLPPSRRPRP
jgi:hypothetical protein